MSRHPKAKKVDAKFLPEVHHVNPLNKQSWATPPGMVKLIAHLIGLAGDAFDLDVCALPATAKARRFYTPDDNGLAQEWAGACWCNPPFKIQEVRQWSAKVIHEVAAGRARLSTFLDPPKSDQDWWHLMLASGLVTGQIDCRGRINFLDEFGRPATAQSEPTTCFVLEAGARCFSPRRGWAEYMPEIDAWHGGWYGSKEEHVIYCRARLL